MKEKDGITKYVVYEEIEIKIKAKRMEEHINYDTGITKLLIDTEDFTIDATVYPKNNEVQS